MTVTNIDKMVLYDIVITNTGKMVFQDINNHRYE